MVQEHSIISYDDLLSFAHLVNDLQIEQKQRGSLVVGKLLIGLERLLVELQSSILWLPGN